MSYYAKFNQNGVLISGPQTVPVDDSWVEVEILQHIPELHNTIWENDGYKFIQKAVPKPVSAFIDKYLEKVDKHCESIRLLFCPFRLQDQEYRLVEKQLQEYKDSGVVGDTIQSHCDSMNVDVETAVASIEEMALGFNNALSDIRRHRLMYKSLIRKSESIEQVEEIYNDFINVLSKYG